MIGWLEGRIVDRPAVGKIVLAVQGVGYDIEVSTHAFSQLENQAQTHMHIHTIVREDAFLLYGFLDKHERDLFRTLIKINGVGPKMAMGILSSISWNALMVCVHQKDVAGLTRLPGIGKKTAERLIVELSHMKEMIESSDGMIVPPCVRTEAMTALEALGYKPQEAHKAVHALDDGQQSCEALIRKALKTLGRGVIT